jgi:hypothetical protein
MTQTNRRLTARLACQLTVSYRADKHLHPATAMDVSGHGCRLRLGEDLARGKSVTVRFQHGGNGRTDPLSADVPGTVIWSRLEGLSHQAGVQFSADPEELEAILLALA